MASLDTFELNRLSDALTREYVALVGSKPRGAKASLEDDILSYSFLDGLDATEDRMRHEGRRSELREWREEELETVGLSLTPVVVEATRSEVSFHVELFDPIPGRTMILFGLGKLASSRERLLAESTALRQEARRLREADVSSREAAVELRTQVRAARRRRESAPPPG